MKKLIIVFLVFGANFAFSQSNFRYLIGISSSFDLLQPKQYDSNFAYFSSTYANGYGINLGLTNKVNYKKMFLRFDFAYNYVVQEQTFVFSNTVDLNISQTIKHTVPHCSFDWSIGRDFALKSENVFQIELGFSTPFSMSIGPYKLSLRKTGTFSSTYSDEELHWSGEMANKEYNYEISYQRPALIAPFMRIGLQVPLKKNYLTFGLTAKVRRLVYENFIVLRSDTYSAIANSRSQSSSVGVFVSYQFGRKLDN